MMPTGGTSLGAIGHELWAPSVGYALQPGLPARLFKRDEQAKTEDLNHSTKAITRLGFLFPVAKIVWHSGAVQRSSQPLYTGASVGSLSLKDRYTLISRHR